MNAEIEDLARATLELCRRQGWMLATAESCTGGLVAAALTAVPGSSDVVDRGFVTYSNEAKTEMLGVPAGLIDAEGAVSRAVAEAMAIGAVSRSRASIAVSITGVAGPGGGSERKPVGLVHFGCAHKDGRLIALERRYGAIERAEIRQAAVVDALRLIDELAGSR